MESSTANPIILVTGAMAAGKSSVAQCLAERLEGSVHLRGDIFRRMIVRGRVDMSAEPGTEARRQLSLRYQAAAQTAKLYSSAGFNVVYQDVVIGPVLADVVAMFRGFPLYVVVLCPRAEVISARERERAKVGYTTITVEQLHRAVEQTPRLGLWVDSSDMSVEETTEVILARLSDARVDSTGD